MRRSPMHAETYHRFLRQFLEFQRALTVAFESTIRVKALPPDLQRDLEWPYNTMIRPDRTISDILHQWPADWPELPLLLWVKPRIGVMTFNEAPWLFTLHGSSQVTFLRLPTTLDAKSVATLR